MHRFSLLLFGGAMLLFITVEAQSLNKVKKKATIPPKSAKNAAALYDETAAPDNEVGTSCFDACFPNETRLEANGKIKYAKKYGVFEKMCGKTYLFGTKQITWTQNWKTCCSLGMAPVMFETLAERQCFSKKFNQKKDEGIIKGPIGEGKSFWLGGFKDDLEIYGYSWCTKNLPTPIDDSMTTDIMAPDPIGTGPIDEKDLKVIRDSKFLRYLPIEDIYTVDKSDAKSVFLACQSVDKLAPPMTPKSDCRTKCKSSKCKNYKNYDKLDVQQETDMKTLFQNGKWISRRGLYFFVAKDLTTQEEARQTCCQLGANVLSIKSDTKRTTIEKMVTNLPQLKAGDWWTSGTDEGCDGNFRWCSVDRPFLKGQVPPWAKGHPKASGDCVTLQLAKNVTLKTQDCSAKKKFICEFPGFGSSSLATVHKNCVNLLGLAKEQEKDLVDVSKYTYKMKCYLRCMGDVLELLENGRLQQGNFLKVENHYLGDGDKNDQNAVFKLFKIIDDCALKAAHNDSSENAFEWFKCLKERMPLLYERVLSWEFGIIIKEITTPRSCSLINSQSCTIDRSTIKMFELQKTTAKGGSAVVDWRGLTWFKSQPNLTHGYSLENAYETCCGLGMRMPTAKKALEFQQMLELMDGNNTDNFFGTTYSSDNGVEIWCSSGELLEPALSADGFRQLPKENSVLVAKKGERKLSAVPLDQIQQHIFVSQFFCQPIETE